MSNKTTPTLSLATDYSIPSEFRHLQGELGEFISPLITTERVNRFKELAALRSRKVMAIFENTNHPHNVSAVLRSIDAFGFQDISFLYEREVVSSRIRDSVERGTSNWLCVKRSYNLNSCAKTLKDAGYLICLVSLPTFARTADHFIDQLPSFAIQDAGSLDFQKFFNGKKIALIFGNEKHGVAERWNNFADCYLYVGMCGFVESLNVSVCAGILFQGLRQYLVAKNSTETATENEQKILLEYWLSRSLDLGNRIILNRRPDLLPYYDFVKAGRFFDPFPR